jgi:multidrug efflux pump subunit AcrB
MREFEKVVLVLPASEVKSILTRTGLIAGETGNTLDSHIGSLQIELVEAKYRSRSMDDIIADVRRKCGHITGTDQVEFKEVESGPPTGADVEAMVKGKYFNELESIVDEIKGELARIPGVTDIKDNFSLGKEELRLHIDEDKADEYGLTIQQIAFAVRNAFDGAKATVFRDGDEEVDVVVKFKASSRATLKDVEDLKLVGAAAVLVPVRDVAHIRVEQGYSEIHRFKQERAITISANVNPEVISKVKANQMLQEHFEELSPRYPGYSLEFGGQFAEYNKAFAGIIQLFTVGILLVYFVLGTQFRSFIQPLVIMTTLPFAFIGAMVGLITSGNPLSIASMYGLVALSGIVVNDSIVLVEFINRQRARGVRKWRAIVNGGRTRLRPTLGIGGRSELWMPMASTIVWGLSVATILTLFVIPAFYAIVDDISTWRGVRVEAEKAESIEEPRGKLQWVPETGGDD